MSPGSVRERSHSKLLRGTTRIYTLVCSDYGTGGCNKHIGTIGGLGCHYDVTNFALKDTGIASLNKPSNETL